MVNIKNQKEETTEKQISKWLLKWTEEDYKRNTQQLLQIGAEYQACQIEADLHKDRKPRLFASDYYQIRNKGTNEKGERIFNSGADNQMYDVNQAKLDKYLAWKMFNRTIDEIELDKIQYAERSKAILDMLKGLDKKLSTITQ